jgi:acyl carrier protein
MSAGTTHERLKEIIIELLGVEPRLVTPETTFIEMGADSLDRVEMTMAVELEFGISIADADADRVKTVGEAVTLIDQLVLRRVA